MTKKGGLNVEETAEGSVMDALWGMGNNDSISKQLENQKQSEPIKEEEKPKVEIVENANTVSQKEYDEHKKQKADNSAKLEAKINRLETEITEKDNKIKKLEERKPAGRKPNAELENFTKYSMNIRPEFLSLIQNYARMHNDGLVALAFDNVIKGFIKSLPKEEIEEIGKKYKEKGDDIKKVLELAN